jgi:hypothetical protein
MVDSSRARGFTLNLQYSINTRSNRGHYQLRPLRHARLECKSPLLVLETARMGEAEKGVWISEIAPASPCPSSEHTTALDLFCTPTSLACDYP